MGAAAPEKKLSSACSPPSSVCRRGPTHKGPRNTRQNDIPATVLHPAHETIGVALIVKVRAWWRPPEAGYAILVGEGGVGTCSC
jgi:hypothetical protein